MSPIIAAAILVVVVIGVVTVIYLVARRRTADLSPGAPADVVSGLMAALRKAEAETAYWRTTAERLQREADER